MPLTARDIEDIQRLYRSPLLRQALAELSGDSRFALDESVSEAVLLHAVFSIGLIQLREAAEEDGYRQLAAGRIADDEARPATARRRRPTWADEA